MKRKTVLFLIVSIILLLFLGEIVTKKIGENACKKESDIKEVIGCIEAGIIEKREIIIYLRSKQEIFNKDINTEYLNFYYLFYSMDDLPNSHERIDYEYLLNRTKMCKDNDIICNKIFNELKRN